MRLLRLLITIPLHPVTQYKAALLLYDLNTVDIAGKGRLQIAIFHSKIGI